MIVNQFHSGTAHGDAITNEMLDLRGSLLSAGYRCDLYAEHVARELRHLIRDIREYKGSPDNVLLVHHSMGFDCHDQIMRLPDRKILIYHNVTPTEFFKDDPFIAAYSESGRAQLRLYRDQVGFAFADSEYNRLELRSIGFRATAVLPPTFSLARLSEVIPNQVLADELKRSTNILYVGRISPNKKQEDVIKAFLYYQNHIDPAARLFLVGGSEDQPGYQRFLEKVAAESRTPGSVVLTGRVGDKDLVAYYRTASVFLSMSEHEGFGVPLVESMLFDVPVVAFKAAAVGFTMGKAGILFSRKDFPLIAEMLYCLTDDEHLRRKTVEAQRARLDELRPEHYIDKLLSVIESPSAPLRIESPAAGKCVQIQGPFETSYSLAIVNRNLARALRRRPGVEVSLCATEGPGDYSPKPEDLADKPDIETMWRRAAGNNRASYVIRNMYPPRVSDVNREQLNFFYFFWEDSLIPGKWADDFNRYLDGMMVPSRHVRQALRNSGVAVPIEIIHAGVELSGGIDGVEDPFHLATDRSFLFLHISSGFPRKGIDVLLRAYTAEFSCDDDVCLLIKTFPNIHNTVAEQIKTLQSGNRRCPDIIHIDGNVDGETIRALYERASCLVHPARAEGFGLPVAEAMLARLPVIATGYSGLTEFCTEETALLVNHTITRSGSHFKVNGACWAEPDAKMLRAQMRAVYQNNSSIELRNRVERAYDNIANNFNWDVIADNAFRFMRAAEVRATRTISAGMVTSWNSRCGIAEYAASLIGAMNDHGIEWSVLSQVEQVLIAEEAPGVVRCWKDRWSGDLSRLLEEVERLRLEVVHFQFNFGFFELQELARCIQELRYRGVRVLITFHSTRDTVIDDRTVSLGQIASTLTQVDRLLVHAEEDRRLLASWGLEDNVTCFPHGFHAWRDQDREEIRNELGLGRSPVISTLGFLLPHKGILELVRALTILKQTYPDVILLALTSIHPDPRSRSHYELCSKAISELGLANHCRLITAFLSLEEIVIALQASDVIALPYHQTNESTSAAVRMPIASHRPVLTTRQAVFEDVADVVHQIDSPSPDAIAEGIDHLLSNPAAAQKLVERARLRVARDSWNNIAGMYSRILRGICS